MGLPVRLPGGCSRPAGVGVRGQGRGWIAAIELARAQVEQGRMRPALVVVTVAGFEWHILAKSELRALVEAIRLRIVGAHIGHGCHLDQRRPLAADPARGRNSGELAAAVLRILIGDNSGPPDSTPAGYVARAGRMVGVVVIRVFAILRFIYFFQPTALGSGYDNNSTIVHR